MIINPVSLPHHSLHRTVLLFLTTTHIAICTPVPPFTGSGRYTGREQNQAQFPLPPAPTCSPHLYPTTYCLDDPSFTHAFDYLPCLPLPGPHSLLLLIPSLIPLFPFGLCLEGPSPILPRPCPCLQVRHALLCPTTTYHTPAWEGRWHGQAGALPTYCRSTCHTHIPLPLPHTDPKILPACLPACFCPTPTLPVNPYQWKCHPTFATCLLPCALPWEMEGWRGWEDGGGQWWRQTWTTVGGWSMPCLPACSFILLRDSLAFDPSRWVGGSVL